VAHKGGEQGAAWPALWPRAWRGDTIGRTGRFCPFWGNARQHLGAGRGPPRLCIIRGMSITTLRWPTLLAAGLLSACSSTWQGPPTPHFDGSRFSNPGHTKESSVAGYLWLRITGAQATWPESVPVAPEPPPPARVDDGSARLTFIGHATVLIQLAGLNILTDPVWSERASPFRFAGPRRVQGPGVAFDALPKINVVLISHNHYDHLDLPTLKRLDERDQPQVIVPLGNKALVAGAMPASRVSEHDWGDSVALEGGATVNLEPMLHGSGRSPFDQQATLWAAFVVQAAGLKIYHVGDAGYGTGEVYRATGRKYGGFDLATLPIGAYEPTSFMADSHMSPAEAVKLMNDVGARRAMAHHFEAFQLGFEAYDAPRKDLQAALAEAQRADGVFFAPRPGQSLRIAPSAP
jgi:L-ascorbate metabolism protein UlaG (beta-lactamase superfamily)